MVKTGTSSSWNQYPIREVTLPRSRVVVSIPEDWHVSDTNAAQRYGKGDAMRTNLALAQRICRFNGEQWPVQDIEEKISGKDWLHLQGELYREDGDEKND